jgi:hypothetical protein
MKSCTAHRVKAAIAAFADLPPDTLRKLQGRHDKWREGGRGAYSFFVRVAADGQAGSDSVMGANSGQGIRGSDNSNLER